MNGAVKAKIGVVPPNITWGGKLNINLHQVRPILLLHSTK